MRKEKYRKGIFAVTYIIENNKPKYLILKRKLHWNGWEFPKGGIEKFETKKRAIKREIKEETGLKILKIKNLKDKGKYNYKKILEDRKNMIGQTYSLFVVEVKKGKVILDKLEHSSCKWMNFKEALKILTWPNQKECLKKVNKYLNSQNL